MAQRNLSPAWVFDQKILVADDVLASQTPFGGRKIIDVLLFDLCLSDLADVRSRLDGRAMPATSGQLILAMNGGQPMAPTLR